MGRRIQYEDYEADVFERESNKKRMGYYTVNGDFISENDALIREAEQKEIIKRKRFAALNKESKPLAMLSFTRTVNGRKQYMIYTDKGKMRSGSKITNCSEEQVIQICKEHPGTIVNLKFNGRDLIGTQGIIERYNGDKSVVVTLIRRFILDGDIIGYSCLIGGKHAKLTVKEIINLVAIPEFSLSNGKVSRSNAGKEYIAMIDCDIPALMVTQEDDLMEIIGEFG